MHLFYDRHLNFGLECPRLMLYNELIQNYFSVIFIQALRIYTEPSTIYVSHKTPSDFR